MFWVGFEEPRAANTLVPAFLPGTAALQAQGASLSFPSSILGELAGCLVNTAGKISLFPALGGEGTSVNQRAASLLCPMNCIYVKAL